MKKNELMFLHDHILLGFFSIALWRIKRFKEGNLDRKKEFSYQELLKRCEQLYDQGIYHKLGEHFNKLIAKSF
jgi:hypothetical protein